VTQTTSRVNRRQKQPFRQSLTIGELAHVAHNMDAFSWCCDWIATYLAKPHPELGRTGNVCPFVAPAITKDSIRIAVVRLTDFGDRRSQILNAITHYREAFLSLGNLDKTHILQAILILFPDVQPHEAPDLIDGTKEELKATFVEQGLMLGEFHAQNPSPGLHNPAFMPLRSSIPMLAIRRMVATDYVFLDRSEYDAGTRLRYIETYLRVSGIADSRTRKDLEQTVAALETELQNCERKPLGNRLANDEVRTAKLSCPAIDLGR